MTPTVEAISSKIWGVDFLKENSTSGITYVLSKTRNSLLPLPEVEGQSLVISVENQTELVAIFRGQSKEEGIQFQLPLGANEIKEVHLPVASDYLLSSTQNLKISAVKIVKAIFPSALNFDSISSPSPLIQVTSTGTSLFERGVGYKLSGLANFYLKQALGKEDFVAIAASGRDVVWRFGELRMRCSLDLTYTVPFTEIPNVFSAGSEQVFYVDISTHQRKYINPAYVAPEAQLWSLENSLVR